MIYNKVNNGRGSTCHPPQDGKGEKQPYAHALVKNAHYGLMTAKTQYKGKPTKANQKYTKHNSMKHMQTPKQNTLKTRSIAYPHSTQRRNTLLSGPPHFIVEATKCLYTNTTALGHHYRISSVVSWKYSSSSGTLLQWEGGGGRLSISPTVLTLRIEVLIWSFVSKGYKISNTLELTSWTPKKTVKCVKPGMLATSWRKFGTTTSNNIEVHRTIFNWTYINIQIWKMDLNNCTTKVTGWYIHQPTVQSSKYSLEWAWQHCRKFTASWNPSECDYARNVFIW